MIINYTDAEKAELEALESSYEQRINEVDAQIKLFNTAESQEKEKEIKSRLPKAPAKVGYDKDNKPIYDAAEKEAYALVLNELSSFYKSRINELKENADYVALKNKRSILMDELNQERRQFESKCEQRQFNELGGDPVKICEDAKDQVTQLINNRYKAAKAEQKEKSVFSYKWLRVDGKNLYIDIDSTLGDCQDFLRLYYDFFKDDQDATDHLRASILEAIEQHPYTSREKGVLFRYVNDPIENALAQNKKDMVYDPNYDVAISNILIQNCVNTLSANEQKLLRLAIIQSKKGDSELYEYQTTAQDFSKFFNIDTKNLYKNLDKMTDNILHASTKLKDESTQRFHKQNWVDTCDYNKGIITIKLAEGLKPYILGLKKCYSKIKIDEYRGYKSRHTIPIRELLESKMVYEKPHADVVLEIPITLEELKSVTNTTKGYEKISRFKAQVLDKAIQEINDYYLGYHVTATPYKNGKSIEGYNFIVESQAHYDFYHKQTKEQESLSAAPGKKTRKKKTQEKEQGVQMTLKDIFEQEF